MQTTIAYDPVALKARLVQRHGADLGELVFDAEIKRREMQDARSTALASQLANLSAKISALGQVEGDRRAKVQAHLARVFADYQKLCEADDQVQRVAQAEIAELHAASIEVQTEMRSIAQVRMNERDLLDFALFMQSANLRALDRKLPPPPARPLTELEKINFSVAAKPRS